MEEPLLDSKDQSRWRGKASIPRSGLHQDADRERRDSGPSERGVHHSSWLTFKSWEDGDDEDSEGGDGSLDESTPLALPSIKLNLYTPQINLEALTANCAKGVLLLTYLLFILCVIVTVESLVRGITVTVFDPVHCSSTSGREPIGTNFEAEARTTSRCSVFESHGASWHGNISGISNLIGTISLSVGLEDNATSPSLCFINGSVPYDRIASVSYSVSVAGCTLDDPSKCFIEGSSRWQPVLSLQDRTQAIAWRSRSDGEELSTVSSWIAQIPIFTGIYQNQEVLRNYGSISAYQFKVTLLSDALDFSRCPLAFTFAYQHAYPLKAFRVIETFMLLVTVTAIVAWCVWLYAPRKGGKSAPILMERHWLTLLLLALLLYQDPIWCLGQWAPHIVRVSAKFSSQTCVSLGQSIFFVVWLLFVDGFRRCGGRGVNLRPSFVVPKMGIGVLFLVGSTGMTVLSFPSVFSSQTASPLLAVNNWSIARKRAFSTYSVIFFGAFGLWLVYFSFLMVRAGIELRRMNYLQTRGLQLSYRFFFLQSLLCGCAYAIVYAVSFVRGVVRDPSGHYAGLRDMDTNAFINHTNALLVPQTQPFGKLLFLFIYSYILLYLHLPAAHWATTRTLTTYYVTTEKEYDSLKGQFRALTDGRRRRKRREGRTVPPTVLFDVLLKKPLRRVKRRLLAMGPNGGLQEGGLPPIFCVETCASLLNLANQAYYDIPGQVTAGGWGELNVEQFGYRVLGAVQDRGSFDTFALVLQHAVDGRVVVAFRGSSSKKQWLNNLRFQQGEIDFSKLPDLHFGVTGARAGGSAASASRHSYVDDDEPGGEDTLTQSSNQAQREEWDGRHNPALHPTPLLGAMATGAELMNATGDFVREGVLGTAHLLGVDRLPYMRRLLRGHVHQGFWEAYLPVREQVAQLVYRVLVQRHGRVFVTGHSLGGALGTLAALDLAINTLPKVDMVRELRRLEHHRTGGGQWGTRAVVRPTELVLYTYGSPRVMNHALASRFHKHVPHCFRVATDGDIVAGLPRYYYKHVGTEVVIDGEGSGSLVIDPSFIERRLRTRTRNKLRYHMLSYYERAVSGALDAAKRVSVAQQQSQYMIGEADDT